MESEGREEEEGEGKSWKDIAKSRQGAGWGAGWNASEALVYLLCPPNLAVESDIDDGSLHLSCGGRS